MAFVSSHSIAFVYAKTAASSWPDASKAFPSFLSFSASDTTGAAAFAEPFPLFFPFFEPFAFVLAAAACGGGGPH